MHLFWLLRIVFSAILLTTWGLEQTAAVNTSQIPSFPAECIFQVPASMQKSQRDGPGCRIASPPFTKPTDSASWQFQYDPSTGSNIRFYLRASEGSAQLTIRSDTSNLVFSDGTGPGGEVALALSRHLEGVEKALPTPSNTWVVTVSNNDVLTRWSLQVDVTDDSIMLYEPHRKILGELHSECCSETEAANIWGNSPCQRLLDWSMDPVTSGKQPKLTLNTDACRYPLNLCDENGKLRVLVLDGSQASSNASSDTEPFFGKCRSPPAALANLTDLYHLELVQLGMSWDLGETLQVLQPLTNLRHLYLPLNNLKGQLGDVQVCNFFQKGPKLEALSLSNAPIVAGQEIQLPSYMGNEINGSVDNCIFNSSLISLNLDFTDVDSVPEMAPNTPLMSLSMKGGYSRGRSNDKSLQTLRETFSYALNLTHLDLSGRMLSGNLTHLPKSLVTADLSRNNFSGELPDLATFSNLVSLDVSGSTLLGGDIVKGVAQSSALELLDLSGTSVGGDLSTSNWTLPQLTYLNLGMTKLRGDLGTCHWDMPVLETLDLFSMDVRGQLNKRAWQVPKLKHLVMHHTNVEGLIPPFLANLPELQHLEFHSNPKIISQAAFAAALFPGNNINFYRVSNCSITDLPDGLMRLGVFTRNCTPLSTPISPADRAAEWQKMFDITGNTIQDLSLPGWLLGPYPSNCFTPALLKSAPEGTQTPGQVAVKLQMPQVQADHTTDNKISCGSLVPSAESLDFMRGHIVQGDAWFCTNTSSAAESISDAMLANYQSAQATQQQSTPTSPTDKTAVLPPIATTADQGSSSSKHDNAGTGKPTSMSASSHHALTPPQRAGMIAGIIVGVAILLGLVALVAVKGYRMKTHRHGIKAKFSLPLAALDSMAKSPGVIILPMPEMKRDGKLDRSDEV